MQPTLRLCIWPHYELRRHWLSVPLTHQEGLMMMALFTHREVTETMFVEFLWPNPFHQPDTWGQCVKDIMARLRGKLAHCNGEITNRWGYGWSYTERTWYELTQDDL